MATNFIEKFPQLDVKFTGTNYREWSISVQLLFDALDLTSHIDGTPPPESGTDAKQTAAWALADRRARGIISSSVEIDIRMQLISLQTALAMWRQLQGLYQQSSHAHSYSVYQELSLAQQDERSIQEFYNFMHAQWRQLAIMEESLCQTWTACACATKQHRVRDQH